MSSASEHRLQKKPTPKDAVLVDHRPDVVIFGPQKQTELRLQEDAVHDGFRRGVSVLEPQTSPRTAVSPREALAESAEVQKVRSVMPGALKAAAVEKACWAGLNLE